MKQSVIFGLVYQNLLIFTRYRLFSELRVLFLQFSVYILKAWSDLRWLSLNKMYVLCMCRKQFLYSDLILLSVCFMWIGISEFVKIHSVEVIFWIIASDVLALSGLHFKRLYLILGDSFTKCMFCACIESSSYTCTQIWFYFLFASCRFWMHGVEYRLFFELHRKNGAKSTSQRLASKEGGSKVEDHRSLT